MSKNNFLLQMLLIIVLMYSPLSSQEKNDGPKIIKTSDFQIMCDNVYVIATKLEIFDPKFREIKNETQNLGKKYRLWHLPPQSTLNAEALLLNHSIYMQKLNDATSYTEQRMAIEKDLAQFLQKISNLYDDSCARLGKKTQEQCKKIRQEIVVQSNKPTSRQSALKQYYIELKEAEEKCRQVDAEQRIALSKVFEEHYNTMRKLVLDFQRALAYTVIQETAPLIEPIIALVEQKIGDTPAIQLLREKYCFACYNNYIYGIHRVIKEMNMDNPAIMLANWHLYQKFKKSQNFADRVAE